MASCKFCLTKSVRKLDRFCSKVVTKQLYITYRSILFCIPSYILLSSQDWDDRSSPLGDQLAHQLTSGRILRQIDRVKLHRESVG
jgi:hypothetical protein